MTAAETLDATDLSGVAAVVFAAKATRFLSRGSYVALALASADDVAEVRAWARWAGHGFRAGLNEHHVVLIVRQGR